MTDYKDIFSQIIADPDYYLNIIWGKPRRGHPEGSVAAHITHLEFNLEKLREKFPEIVSPNVWKFKILIHTHDTFKAQAQSGTPISDPRNHGHIARNFLARYCDDQDLLNMVLCHDEGYNTWKQMNRGQPWQDRFDNLMNQIVEWNLFLPFCIIDATTPGKGLEAITWYFDQAAAWLKANSVSFEPGLRTLLE